MRGSTEPASIAALGSTLGPDVVARVQAMFADEQRALAAGRPPVAIDAAYGTHPRQRLDVYVPQHPVAAARVLLWVHGGGFVRGEKASPDHPFNAHVGRWAARCGMIGVVMNYRLAPESCWPSGGEDVAAAVAWIVAHAASFGGDPGSVILAGTSAGATHIATALQGSAIAPAVRGAILLSGLYGATPGDARDAVYLGAGMPLDPVRIAACGVPLFLACAEYDPPRFQDETIALVAAVRRARGRAPAAAIVSGHNHYSLACHLGGSDRRLADMLRRFIDDTCDHDSGGRP